MNQMSSEHDEAATTLRQHLDQLRTLAARLPSGDGEDHVRRCVRELIDAAPVSQQHHAMNLLKSIACLQHERQQGLRRPHQHGTLAVDRLFTAFCDTVVPLL